MKIIYICNGQAECNKSLWCMVNGGPCTHTCDIKFVKVSDDYSELKYFEEE